MLVFIQGHKQGYGNNIMDEAISIFGKCFRKTYIPDLIFKAYDFQKISKKQEMRELQLTIAINLIQFVLILSHTEILELPIKKPPLGHSVKQYFL